MLSGDSAFPGTWSNQICPGRILRCRKANEPDPESHLEVLREREARAVRQGSEWGMGAIQNQWHRLKCGELEDAVKPHRKMVMVNAIRLFNFRTRMVGLNQIQSFWYELLSEDLMNKVYRIGSK